jgi:NAD(P)-dependent dehydrogenase (short-subunit alcohol dehydrogenase family)
MADERRVAVVTGGTRGLGRAYAGRLARDGFDVAIVDLAPAPEALDDARASGREAMCYQADVSAESAVEQLRHEVLGHFGRVDAIVNNAGVFPHAPFENLTYADWQHVINVNLSGPFLMAKAFVPGMRERGWGRIINVASATCWLVVPAMAHYIASKAGVVGLTRALASELGRDGITANAVAPGLIRTPGTEAGPEAAMFETAAVRQAIPRAGMPDDLVGTISFLASEDSAFMSGQVLLLDGGIVRL